MNAMEIVLLVFAVIGVVTFIVTISDYAIGFVSRRVKKMKKSPFDLIVESLNAGMKAGQRELQIDVTEISSEDWCAFQMGMRAAYPSLKVNIMYNKENLSRELAIFNLKSYKGPVNVPFEVKMNYQAVAGLFSAKSEISRRVEVRVEPDDSNKPVSESKEEAGAQVIDFVAFKKKKSKNQIVVGGE